MDYKEKIIDLVKNVFDDRKLGLIYRFCKQILV